MPILRENRHRYPADWPSNVVVTLGPVNERTGWREHCEVSDGLRRIPFKYDHALDLKGKTQEVLNVMISRLRHAQTKIGHEPTAPSAPDQK